ncbi:hypothetical protein G5S52_11460 [Grimontia sp. S25]|uniref:DUF6701 domain-containing protein n=1 Tax=Grimontia sedimenti TaxID=2711294 RepID=A0A6M1RFH2_9GAMM|nr:DUF6701 domain-containing protein [Grimontia sedimenti]NGN98242.1 hypothetical protein [Grimontia sedimenti]
MIKQLSIVWLFFFSATADASLTSYFPGPAQSQAPLADSVKFKCGSKTSIASSCVVAQSESMVEHLEQEKVFLGFGQYDKKYNAKCGDGGVDGTNTVPCERSDLIRATYVGLEPLEVNKGTHPLVNEEKQFSSYQSKNFTLTPSEPRYKVVRVLQNVNLHFKPGIYYFGDLIISDSVNISVEGEVEIHVNSLKVGSSSTINYFKDTSFSTYGEPSNLILWVHNNSSANASVSGIFDAQFGEFSKTHAYVYADGVVKIAGSQPKQNFGTIIYGAVTARYLELGGYSKLKYAAPRQSYKLNISPETATASGCNRIPLTFSILDSNDVLQDDVNGLLDVSVTSPNQHACWATDGMPNSNCTNKWMNNVPVVNGVAHLWLGGSGGDVSVKGTFKNSEQVEGTLEDTAGPFHFEKIGLRLNAGSPLKLVAGKEENVLIEVVKSAGNGQSCSVKHINGTFDLEASTKYDSPSTGTKLAYVNGISANGSNPNAITFTEGKADLDVRYNDAGEIAIPINIPIFANIKENNKGGLATEASDEPEGKDYVSELTGDIIVHSRPYTFAFCGMPGNPDNAFKMAGESFGLALTPVIWSGGNDLNGTDLTNGTEAPLASSFCQREATPNFWKMGAPEAFVTLDETAIIKKPTGGKGAQIHGIAPKAHTQVNASNRYRFNGLSVSDVGSFGIRSKLTNPYLGMIVNPGELEVGRFYPAYFSLSGNITPAISDNQDSGGEGFTYMNQPFEGQYTVLAMNAKHQAVKNYHLFDDADKAQFVDWAMIPSSGVTGYESLTSRWQHPSSRLTGRWIGDGETGSRFSFSGNMMVDKGSSPDGPYPELKFVAGVDPSQPDRDGTDFRFCNDSTTSQCVEKLPNPDVDGEFGAEFAQGEFMFGRMRMEGFTETQDLSREQTMPVVVEVFNGQRFVTNTRDNASEISTDIGEKEVLFSSTSEEANRAQIFLRDSANRTITKKTVENGRSEFVVKAPAQNGNLNREQFRYWQRLDTAIGSAAPQTWLQHNWQGAQFDDDPSAIGTFGFYRGSDRVIYKGEKNITLTGE